MQHSDLVAGLDAELLVKCGSQLAVCRERFGLASAAIQSQHPLPVQSLTQRMLGDEPAQLGGERLVVAKRQLGVGPGLPGAGAHLVQPA